ncbi:MAG: hypothetical protein IJ760_00640 [Bacteroidales bacterium]|nr:hypothetical protein [Bacteroidales bacterium]
MTTADDKIKRRYEAPRLITVSFRSEMGYSMSMPMPGFLKGGSTEDDSIESQRQDGGYWGGYEDSWF